MKYKYVVALIAILFVGFVWFVYFMASNLKTKSALIPLVQNDNRPDKTIVYAPKDIPELTAVNVHPYGNNVYYFAQTGADFGNTLVDFLEKHKGLEVSSMAPHMIRMNKDEPFDRSRKYSSYSSYSDYGMIVGYFVTFREKLKG